MALAKGKFSQESLGALIEPPGSISKSNRLNWSLSLTIVSSIRYDFMEEAIVAIVPYGPAFPRLHFYRAVLVYGP
jgi:hypothetical protein